jgi:hypothetical protein
MPTRTARSAAGVRSGWSEHRGPRHGAWPADPDCCARAPSSSRCRSTPRRPAVDLAIGVRLQGRIFIDGDGARLDRHSAGRIVRRIARRGGIAKRVGPHTLRHAFITAPSTPASRSLSSPAASTTAACRPHNKFAHAAPGGDAEAAAGPLARRGDLSLTGPHPPVVQLLAFASAAYRHFPDVLPAPGSRIRGRGNSDIAWRLAGRARIDTMMTQSESRLSAVSGCDVLRHRRGAREARMAQHSAGASEAVNWKWALAQARGFGLVARGAEGSARALPSEGRLTWCFCWRGSCRARDRRVMSQRIAVLVGCRPSGDVQGLAGHGRCVVRRRFMVVRLDRAFASGRFSPELRTLAWFSGIAIRR